MSDSTSSPKASPSLLSSLRKFRFQRTNVANGNVKEESSQEKEKASSVSTPPQETANTPIKPSSRRFGRIIDSDSDDCESSNMSIIELRKEIAKNFENLTPGLTKNLKNGSTENDSDSEVFNNTDKNLKILANEFPEMDEMELLDVLARNSMDIKRTRNVLMDNNSKGQKEKPKTHVIPRIEEEGGESIKQDLNGIIQRQWKRISKDKKPIAPNKRVKKRKIMDSDEDEDDENPFEEHKVYESEDSDEENVVDVATVTTDKTAVLDFFSTATFLELAAVPSCSRKKAETIISLRPFESWGALVKKLQKNKTVGPDLLNASHTVLRLRKMIARLMQQCKNLSEKMEEIVRSVQSGEVKTASIKVQPRLIPSHLKLAGYQMIGLNWLFLMHKQHLSGILADEMGLGKTIQIIAFLAYLKQREMDRTEEDTSDEDEENGRQESDFDEDAKTHLIVCPASTLENWSNELKRWCPSLKVTKYHGSQEERQQIRYQWIQEGFKDIDVIVTNYHMVAGSGEGKIFRKLPLDYVIFDEAHMLKNMATQRYETLIKIKGNHRVLLTGTPLQNNLVELMSLLVFVMPGMFAGKKDCLKQLFSMYPRQTTSNSTSNLSNSRDESNFEKEQVRRAKEIMRPFFLRRLKQDVLQDLPKKTEKVLYVELTERQRELYQSLIGKYSKNADEIVNHLDDDDSEDTKSKSKKSRKEVPLKQDEPSGMSIMMQLRKMANHPLLVRNLYDDKRIKEMAVELQKDPLYQEDNLTYIIEDLGILCDYELHRLCLGFKCILRHKLDKNMLLTSGKFQKFDEIFPSLKKEGHRVLIFSQFIMVMDLIGDYLAYNGYRFLRLDGSTPVSERQAMIDEYNREEEIFAFILSTKAGGMGINLTAADTVVIHDLDFNPYNDKQAEDRCHRVGQLRDVTIIRLIGKDTIEEGIYLIAQDKLHLEREITTGDEGHDGVKDGKNIARLLKQILGHDTKMSSQAT